MKHTLLSLLFLCAIFSAPALAGAETYTPLTDTLGFAEAAEASSQGDFAAMVNLLYKLAIGVGTMLAVLMIIWAGFEYSVTSVANKKSDMKGRITMALGGLALLVSAYVVLTLINPALTQYNGLSLGAVSSVNTDKDSKGIEANARDTDVRMDIRDEEDLEQYMTNPTEEQYEELFGRAPAPNRVQNGRVLLTSDEQSRMMQRLEEQSRSGGIRGIGDAGEFVGGTRCVKTSKNIDVDVPEANIAMVALSIRNACSAGKNAIPSEWAFSESYYKIVACESSGKVGNINYQMRPYLEARGISFEEIVEDIQSDTFYQKHCCSLRNSSNKNTRNKVLSEPNGEQCNPGTQSQLIATRGNCYSAAGFGQLLVYNMKTYQPDGVRGFNDPANEICGMLNYIKATYGSPDEAWRKYNTDRNGDGVVDEGY